MEAVSQPAERAAQSRKRADPGGREMVPTPWGDSDRLRARRLPPGRGRPRAEVRENQRERLLGAMLALASERGYGGTSISELAALSGVSSRAFYELFEDKERCLIETLEAIEELVRGGLEGELRRDGAVEERMMGMARGLARAAGSNPAAARLMMIESFRAGERTRARVEEARLALAALMGGVLEELGGGARMPEELARAILSGIGSVVYNRVAAGREAELAELAPRLCDWAIGIPPPPGPLPGRARRRRSAAADAPPFAAHVPAERVLRGFAAAVAERGYAGTTIAEIAAAASISQNTFYAHFRDKEDAMAAALDSSGAQLMSVVLPAARRAGGWPAPVRAAIEAMCGFLAAEPAYAQLRIIEVYGVGPEAVLQRDGSGDELMAVLAAVAEEPLLDPERVEVEATLGAINSLFYERIRDQGAGAAGAVAAPGSYLMLAPILGAEEAWRVARG